MGDERSLADLIEIAINREEAAYNFYMDIHGKVNDKGVRDTLEWIANEEKKHKEFLVNFRNENYDTDSFRKREARYYKIAEHQKEPELQKGEMANEEVFLIAAHRELRSYEFYSELTDLQPDGQIKEILQKMAQEELKHKEKMEYLYTNTAYPQTSGG